MGGLRLWGTRSVGNEFRREVPAGLPIWGLCLPPRRSRLASSEASWVWPEQAGHLGGLLRPPRPGLAPADIQAHQFLSGKAFFLRFDYRVRESSHLAGRGGMLRGSLFSQTTRLHFPCPYFSFRGGGEFGQGRFPSCSLSPGEALPAQLGQGRSQQVGLALVWGPEAAASTAGWEAPGPGSRVPSRGLRLQGLEPAGTGHERPQAPLRVKELCRSGQPSEAPGSRGASGIAASSLLPQRGFPRGRRRGGAWREWGVARPHSSGGSPEGVTSLARVSGRLCVNGELSGRLAHRRLQAEERELNPPDRTLSNPRNSSQESRPAVTSSMPRPPLGPNVSLPLEMSPAQLAAR